MLDPKLLLDLLARRVPLAQLDKRAKLVLLVKIKKNRHQCMNLN